MFIGIPMRAKSEKRYPPGPYTIMCVGEPIGVAKLDDTEIISATQNVRGFTSMLTAVWNAIGKKMAAVAVLLVNSVMNVPTRQMLANAMIGFPLHADRMPFEIHWAIPVS